jgi:hypothetical protein
MQFVESDDAKGGALVQKYRQDVGREKITA